MDLTTLSDEELDQHRRGVLIEQERRATLERGPDTIARLNCDYLQAEGTKPGQPWRPPTGAHNAYPQGWQVQYGGKQWESLTPANVWEPGTSGWREVTAEGETPAWRPPSGAHDAYPAGATVTHDRKTWTSDLDGNVWVPGEYGWTAQ